MRIISENMDDRRRSASRTFGDAQLAVGEDLVGLHLVGPLKVLNSALEIPQMDLGIPALPQNGCRAWLALLCSRQGSAGILMPVGFLQQTRPHRQHSGVGGLQLACPAFEPNHEHTGS